ncbi:GAF domain-containing sensor histidine kinase [Desertivirga brevis]|uniref:GAF domain-containing sensor histidine kinase n=1 Tax=Desertivirga brevis TaxID=2810310 RepID=UPI001A95DB37|nr:GAF domain-containing sensor histidine kinase [Pedobacter sp. SYSU D00873]
MVTDNKLPINIQEDIRAITEIEAIPGILKVVCHATGLGFAAVARVTDLHWVACSVKDDIAFGLQAGEQLRLVTTICNEIRQHKQPVVIDHVSEDETFANHHTPAMYGFQSYISYPIFRHNGEFFGTLCAIDPKPAKLKNPQIMEMFKLFAELISFHLHTLQQIEVSKSELQEEQKTAEFREQFIAILAHDLRNPLGAITSGIQVLKQMPLEKKADKLLGIIQNSSFRMQALIENMLDFARGRFGNGFSLHLQSEPELDVVLHHVIDELRVIWPNRQIEVSFNADLPVICDSKRIGQLFSNILGNALIHGAADKPVFVTSESKESRYILKVKNSGDPIPSAAMERLFKPFSRSEVKPGQQGLGLGLYIASEIAKAHGGNLVVSSDPVETCFSLILSCRE